MLFFITVVILTQGDFAPQGNLALSRDIFHCQNWRVGVQMASGILMNFLEEVDSPATKNYPVQWEALVLKWRNCATKEHNPWQTSFGIFYKLFPELWKYVFFMYVNYAGNFQRCSYAIITSPRAHMLMSSLNNLQMHTHFYLLKQWLTEPLFPLCYFSMKQFHSEQKVVVIHRITTGFLKTWNNAGLNQYPWVTIRLLYISSSTREIWGLTSQLCNSFVNSNYSASACRKEGKANEMAVMQLHHYWSLHIPDRL